MKAPKHYAHAALLLLCGAILLAIGLSITVSPASFYADTLLSGAAMPEANLLDNQNLLSELRAPAGMLVATGIVVIFAGWLDSLRAYAWLVSALVYLSYGLARVLGFWIDGLPDESLIWAAVIELVLGGLSLVMLIQLHRSNASGNQQIRGLSD